LHRYGYLSVNTLNPLTHRKTSLILSFLSVFMSNRAFLRDNIYTRNSSMHLTSSRVCFLLNIGFIWSIFRWLSLNSMVIENRNVCMSSYPAIMLMKSLFLFLKSAIFSLFLRMSFWMRWTSHFMKNSSSHRSIGKLIESFKCAWW
jgi:hypothetical protein